MLAVRKSEERGLADHGWLKSRHTFSFAEYYDPQYLGFRTLRVINEDRVAGGAGFPTHGHRDMEIISYVLDGALEHKDTIGTRSVIRPGEVQRMSAGTGIHHSEFNHSPTDPVHFLQIWIIPEQRGLEPGYEQKAFPEEEKRNRLRLVGSRDGREGSITIHQDVDLYATRLDPDRTVTMALRPERFIWVHVAKGTVRVNGVEVGAGDAVAMAQESELSITGITEAEALIFDLA